MVPTPCDQPRTVPIVTFHGTADPILRFNGGAGDLGGILGGAKDPANPTTSTTAPAYDLDGKGYPENVRRWAERNGCDPSPTDTQVSDEVIHRVYRCPPGADLEFYVVVGGGHSWPSSEFSQSIGNIVGHTTFDIDATKASWEFFERFTL
jgi:polyhydroxybutyrate depolymerase